MPRSQANRRTLTTRRAHRPDSRIYRTLRIGRSARRRRRNIGLWIAFCAVLASALVAWLILRH